MVRFELDVDWHRAAWIGLGVVLALAIVWVVYSFVGTFVFGVFIYYATRRLYRRVRRRVRPPSLAAAASLGLLALPALALLGYTLVVGLQQLSEFTSDVGASESFAPVLAIVQPYIQLSEGIGDPQVVLSDLIENPGALLSNGGVGTATDALGTVLGSLGIIFTGLLHLFVMLALAFYLLRDGPQMSRWLSNFTDLHGVLDEYAREVDRSLDKVFYGNILNAAITGTIGAIAYSALNVVAPGPLAIPYAVLLGLLTGIASLIPVVGMKLVYVPVTAYLAALTAIGGNGAWWFVSLFVAVSFLLVDTIPDLVVRPYVSGGSLHVGALMFAYILGPLLWGWYGIFLGPVLLVLVVHFARIVAPELLTGRPIEPYSVDPSNLVDPTPASPPQSDSGTPHPEGTDGGQSEPPSDSEE